MKFLPTFAKLSLCALFSAAIGRGGTINHQVVITIESNQHMMCTFDGAPQFVTGTPGHWRVQLFLGNLPKTYAWLEHTIPNGLVNLLRYRPEGGGSFTLDTNEKRSGALRNGMNADIYYQHPNPKEAEVFRIILTDQIH
jgi:hypothetical protein